MSTSPRYLRHPRGDRLRPWPVHTRYHVLRQLAALVREVAADPRVHGDLLVDFGSGDSPYAPLFNERFSRYVRADIEGNPRADVVIGADGVLPLPPGCASAVLSSQVLEHVPDPRAYLAEARRVLAPEGWLILSTHGAWKYHPDPTDYWRWTRDGLHLELERAGFVPVLTRAALGRAATTVQLLQDAAADALPRVLRPFPGLVLQRVIGLLERWRTDPAPPDAAVYLVLARRAS